METAKSVHGVGYTVWTRLGPVVDVLEAQGRIARPQSHKDGADPYKMIKGGLYSDTPSGKSRMVLYGS